MRMCVLRALAMIVAVTGVVRRARLTISVRVIMRTVPRLGAAFVMAVSAMAPMLVSVGLHLNPSGLSETMPGV
jgi:hypothetical protein